MSEKFRRDGYQFAYNGLPWSPRSFIPLPDEIANQSPEEIKEYLQSDKVRAAVEASDKVLASLVKRK